MTTQHADVDPAEVARTVPPGALEAVHRLEVATEWIERAFGALLDAHHATGHAQEMLLEAAGALEEAGHEGLGRRARAVAARDAVHDRWTYQVVDEYRAHLLGPVRDLDEAVRGELTGGVRHCFEARQKRDTAGTSPHTGVRGPEGGDG